MLYHMTASGTVDAAGDQEIIEIAKLAESDSAAPGDVQIRVLEPSTGRVVYETPAPQE